MVYCATSYFLALLPSQSILFHSCPIRKYYNSLLQSFNLLQGTPCLRANLVLSAQIMFRPQTQTDTVGYLSHGLEILYEPKNRMVKRNNVLILWTWIEADAARKYHLLSWIQ